LNKLSQFWQELKRRKVVRVITVYAAAAFVILELVSIIVEPLKLPEWFLPMVIVLLCIGFIIAIILSWIYDIKPEGGIVKTEPATKVSEKATPSSSRGWKIASYFSFVVIVALIALNFIPRTNRSKELEIFDKSIAVLPFINDSPEKENEHIITGYMMSISNNLSEIRDLRVMPRASVEQYRNNTKPIPEIAEELNVGYLLYASGQKFGNRIILTVQLIDANANLLWSNPYDRSITNVEDHITLQSEIAQLVANEIEAVITPEEKQRIEKVPTTSLTAYDFYQRGREEYWRSLLNREYVTALKQAEYFFNKALEYDPGYASAFAGLAMVLYSKYLTWSRLGEQYSTDYYQSRNLDSMNLLAQKALVLDDQIADAYFAKGVYEQERGNLKKGLEYMNDALKINPNHTLAMLGAASIYGYLYDYVNELTMLHKAASMDRGSPLSEIYYQLCTIYWEMDFPEKSLQYLEEFLSLSGDSITYFIIRYYWEHQAGNQEKANEFAAAAYEVDSTHVDAIHYMGRSNLDSKRFKEAYPYYLKYYSQLETFGNLDVNDMHRMGYALWMTGRKEKAQFYFQETIDHCKRHIEINSRYGRGGASLDLAGIYAFIGEKDSAYYYLEEFSRTNAQYFPLLNLLQFGDPLFESIRQEDRFQKLLRDMEDKYQAEHERVRQWLEENDML